MLLIGCLNVANLALVRSKVRAKEMATRLALGAPSWQLARQLVVENVLLTAVAGVQHQPLSHVPASLTTVVDRLILAQCCRRGPPRDARVDGPTGGDDDA